MLFYLAVLVDVSKMYSKDFRGASGASRLIFQSATCSSFASGTACFICTIERTLIKKNTRNGGKQAEPGYSSDAPEIVLDQNRGHPICKSV